MKKKIVMGLSGGMDSTTILGLAIDWRPEDEIHCCVFDYGSTHNQYENEAAFKVVEFFRSLTKKKIQIQYINISGIMKEFSSHLLLSNNQAIPEGEYNSETMAKTVVPGRNLIFASIMAGIAESIDAQTIALGIHQGDHHIYPDCRVEFAKALDAVIYLSTDRKVEVWTPLIYETKASILRMGRSLPIPIPYHLTRTCYKNQPISCGKCGSCRERIEAFDQIGIPDPINYQHEEGKKND